MGFFAENMKRFTGEVAACHRERSAVLKRLRLEADDLRSDAQSFLRQLGDEHQAVAEHVRSTLANERRDRTQQVEALRHEFRDRFHKMREQLQQTLAHCRNARRDFLRHKFRDFRQSRRRLAGDLQDASRIWRGHG